MRRTHSHVSACLILTAALAVLGAGLAWAGHTKGKVDELRFGTAVDAKGKVVPEDSREHFVAGSPIHITMDVQEALKGTDLMVSVVDRETEELVWSAKQEVPGGHTTMHFMINPGELKPGKYRAKVNLGEEMVAEYEFKVAA